MKIRFIGDDETLPRTVLFGAKTIMIETPVALREIKKAKLADENGDEIAYERFINNAIKAEQGQDVPNISYNPANDDITPLFIQEDK